MPLHARMKKRSAQNGIRQAREFTDNAKGMAGGTAKEISLIIDGEALEMTLCPEIAPHLLSFAKLCRAVICNRVSPAITRDHIEKEIRST